MNARLKIARLDVAMITKLFLEIIIYCITVEFKIF